MTIPQQALTIGMVVLGTMITRFLPFAIFPGNQKTPPYIQYLGKVLPSAVLALLVVYCFKEVNITAFPFGLPEVIAVAAVAGLHLWKKNMFLSIAAGTVLYMVLVQFIF